MELLQHLAITENSGETLTDYQVLVELSGGDFPTEAQPDGDDIRFIDASDTELSYWIGEWDAGSKEAKIWVNVPSILASGETKLKMYYGNPSASAVSDGDATFEFFDDFEDYTGDIDGQGGWSVITAGSSTATVSDGILDLNRDGSNDVQVTHSIILPEIFLYRVRIKPENFNSNKRWFLWDGVDYSTHVSFWFERSGYARHNEVLLVKA